MSLAVDLLHLCFYATLAFQSHVNCSQTPSFEAIQSKYWCVLKTTLQAQAVLQIHFKRIFSFYNSYVTFFPITLLFFFFIIRNYVIYVLHNSFLSCRSLIAVSDLALTLVEHIPLRKLTTDDKCFLFT